MFVFDILRGKVSGGPDRGWAVENVSVVIFRVAQTTGLGAAGTRSVSRDIESRPPFDFNNSPQKHGK